MAAVESIESLRLLLASLIRSRVVGDDPDDRMAAVMLAPGDRWFADDRPIRRVHADASMFVGGLRALLLQSLHPLAMAGVAQHSDYRTDPWGRLQRTADYLAVTTFGPAVDAELVVARVRAVHERVKGTARDGRSYSAGDPHLLRWVHICEVDSFLAAHRVYGAEPLTRAEADAAIRRHRIVERFLADMLGYAWNEADRLAVQFEHEIPQEVEDRIYNTKDFDRTLVLDDRTKLTAKKVTEFLKDR